VCKGSVSVANHVLREMIQQNAGVYRGCAREHTGKCYKGICSYRREGPARRSVVNGVRAANEGERTKRVHKSVRSLPFCFCQLVCFVIQCVSWINPAGVVRLPVHKTCKHHWSDMR